MKKGKSWQDRAEVDKMAEKKPAQKAPEGLFLSKMSLA